MKSMKRNLATMALLYLSLVLAACGGGASPPPASATCTWDSSTWDNCTWGG